MSIESNDPESEVVTVELSGYGGDSEPPRIFEPSEDSEITVYVVEEFDLELHLEADDPDHENDQLVWSVEDADDLPGEQGDALDFQDNEDGSADFTWTVGEDMASEEPYRVVLRVTDPVEAFDEITMLIIVRSDPLPPPEEIPDQELLEDSDRIILCDLDTFVAEDDPRIFTFDLFESPLQLCLEIDPMTNELSAFPEKNFCTDEDGLEVTIHTVASYIFFYQMDFRVIVHPLNDPPGEFNLLTPEDNYQTRRFEGVLHFSWDEASQNEYEVDDVYYRLVFGESMDSQDSLVIHPVDVNEYEITVHDLLILLGDNNIRPSLQLLWWVTANDDSTETMATNAPFSLMNLAVSGEDRTGIPDNFVLLPAFPNPFNAQVSIGFGLPARGWVTLSLVNSRGQSIRSLSQIGWYSAGYQMIGLDLEGLPAGSYFLHLDYNGRMLTQPIVLIK